MLWKNEISLDFPFAKYHRFRKIILHVGFCIPLYIFQIKGRQTWHSMIVLFFLILLYT